MSITRLPVKLASAANLREHWSARHRRVSAHRALGRLVPVEPLPCIVRLVRIAPRALDDDNLAAAFKAVRDGIADRLGVADNDPRVTWQYGQRRGAAKQYAVEITIETRRV